MREPRLQANTSRPSSFRATAGIQGGIALIRANDKAPAMPQTGAHLSTESEKICDPIPNGLRTETGEEHSQFETAAWRAVS
jgi:hypothetical protein